jgi:hypothetical protein
MTRIKSGLEIGGTAINLQHVWETAEILAVSELFLMVFRNVASRPVCP